MHNSRAKKCPFSAQESFESGQLVRQNNSKITCKNDVGSEIVKKKANDEWPFLMEKH